MDRLEDGLKDLKEIRSIMEHASRFLSLSGLSGVSAGVVGLLAAGAALWYLSSAGLALGDPPAETFLIAAGAAALVLAVALSFLFSYRMALRQKLPFWSPAARDVLESLLVPLASGGGLAVILIARGYMPFVPGTTLLFYGLALVAASRQTVRDLRNLGFLQIVFGLLAFAFPALALLLWGAGFGLLHVAYGLLMYWKYER